MFVSSHLLMPARGLLIIGASEAQIMPIPSKCKKKVIFFQLFPDSRNGCFYPRAYCFAPVRARG